MYGLAKLAAYSDIKEIERLYNEAYVPNETKKVKTGLFRYKEIPEHSPDQEDKQFQFYEDGHENKVIDHFGQQALQSGTYSGPEFKDLFEGVYPLNDETAALVKKYPRLLDAMKEDSERDMGGILHNFQWSLDMHKDHPQKQEKLYGELVNQLDNNRYYGWKAPLSPDDFE